MSLLAKHQTLAQQCAELDGAIGRSVSASRNRKLRKLASVQVDLMLAGALPGRDFAETLASEPERRPTAALSQAELLREIRTLFYLTGCGSLSDAMRSALDIRMRHDVRSAHERGIMSQAIPVPATVLAEVRRSMKEAL